MNVLLTSCGLETKTIEAAFMAMLPKPLESIKAMFVPTAAISPDAIEVLPKCLNDLLKCGIKRENICVYDLHEPMGETALKLYDVIYLCGGDSEYLLKRINESGFDKGLEKFMEQGGIVVGVSAGSVIFAGNIENNLGLLKCDLSVHYSDEDCETAGTYPIDRKEKIRLGNRQAIVLNDDDIIIIE